MKFLACSLLCLTALAQSRPPAPKAPTVDKAKLEAYLRYLELWVPDVSVKLDDPKPMTGMPGFNTVVAHLSYKAATLDLTYYVSDDGTKVFKGDVYDLAKSPFQKALDTLKTEGQPNYNGDDKSPVKLLVFGDFECPYCKAEASTLRQQIPAAFPGKVRVYFMDFPLDSIHPWARPASIAGRCVLRQSSDVFWKYHDWIYDQQTEIKPDNFNAKLMEWAGKNGVDSVQLGRCVDSKATEAEVNRTQQMGQSIGVDATPTLFLNGRKLVDQMAQWPTLQQLITLEIDHQGKAAQEAEKCCTVEIPTIGK
ncbi:MAG: DsbA family protein [Bryobacterales bacterium]|nr:DsbA family protein [Bryobacterales bacterium]MBV9401239.1 DsbA family protein [Bryobacterales bacterium]